MSDISYDFEFGPLDVYYNHNGLQDVVHTVNWKVSATIQTEQTTVVKNTSGIVTLDTLQINTFTPFSELTKDMVQSWVISSLGQERVRMLSSSLSQSIEESLSPVSRRLSVPWV